MGLVALWAVGPKYGDRQLAEEHKAQGRIRAVELAATGETVTEVSSAGDLAIPLQPLYAVLGGVLIIAWAVLWWRHLAPRPAANAEGQSAETTPEAHPWAGCWHNR